MTQYLKEYKKDMALLKSLGELNLLTCNMFALKRLKSI